MKKPKLPNQKKAYKDLGKRLNAYTRKIISIYETLAKESAKIATSTDFDGMASSLLMITLNRKEGERLVGLLFKQYAGIGL